VRPEAIIALFGRLGEDMVGARVSAACRAFSPERKDPVAFLLNILSADDMWLHPDIRDGLLSELHDMGVKL